MILIASLHPAIAPMAKTRWVLPDAYKHMAQTNINILTREFIEGVVGDGISELKIQDPYECHAFINLRFVCAECGVEILQHRLRALLFALRCHACEDERETGQRHSRDLAEKRAGTFALFDPERRD